LIDSIAELRERLFNLSDEKYGKFSSSLIPNIDRNAVLGVKLPLLRKIAKEITDRARVELFRSLPHKYLEEDHLHSFLISSFSDYEECMRELESFLPYIDNWAVCDSLRPACFGKAPPDFLSAIDSWLASSHAYTVRFAIEMLMIHFLGDKFSPDIIKRVSAIRSEDYYVKMMIAWFFAEAVIKRWDETIGYLKEKNLSPWVHNKCISKCNDSFRLSAEQKDYLRKLRIK